MKTNAGDGQMERRVSADVGLTAVKAVTKAEAYAASLVELARTEAALDLVDQDLRLVKSTISEHMRLKQTLADSDLPVEKKQRVIEEIFGAKVSMVTLNFLQLLSGMGQMEILPQVAEEFARRLQAEENKSIAEVTTAIPLDTDYAALLAERLSKLTGRQVTIRPKVDTGIIGGVVVRVDGRLLDGSVRHQLDRLRDQMLVDMKGE